MYNLADAPDYFPLGLWLLLSMFLPLLASLIHWCPLYIAGGIPCWISKSFSPPLNHCKQNMGFGLLRFCFHLFQALGFQLLSSHRLPKTKKLQLVPKIPVLIFQCMDCGY